MPQLSPDAQELAYVGLERGMQMIVTPGETLTAFVITEHGVERRLHEFDTENAGKAASMARYFLRSAEGVERAVVVWDGVVRKPNGTTDAVLAEVYVAGEAHSELFAQCYRPGSRLRAARPLGEILELGSGHPLF